MKNKIKIKVEILKPRNHLVPELFKLKSGSHQKPEKSLRRQIKVQTEKNNQEEI